MKYELIGIHGRKRSGKDTAGRIIQAKTGFNMDSFADPIRKFGFNTFGITEENRENLIESIGFTGRQVLQLVGTEIGRQLTPRFWIESLKHRNHEMVGLIITDVRFDNEASTIKDCDGIILKINRPSLEVNIDTHTSEMPIDDKYVDYQINNDCSLEDYEHRVDTWITNILNS